MLSLYDLKRIPRTWRTAKIPKKDGGVRTLTIPNDELKELQSDILQYLYELVRQKRLQISAVSHGFMPFHSCLTSVMKHDRESEIFLCTDMLHAFDLMDPQFAAAKLLDAGVSPDYVKEIIGACSYNNALPQGGPTVAPIRTISPSCVSHPCPVVCWSWDSSPQPTRSDS